MNVICDKAFDAYLGVRSKQAGHDPSGEARRGGAQTNSKRWTTNMPLWTIYHPVQAFTADEKKAIASKITEVYAILPKFYVNVVFQAVSTDDFYCGGEKTDDVVRFAINHVARSIAPEHRLGFLKIVNDALAPFIADRGFRWELHIDESPRDLWTVQGYVPPASDSDDEVRWIRENRASPPASDPMAALTR